MLTGIYIGEGTTTSTTTTTIKYGFLYNGYATEGTGTSSLTSSDNWVIPTQTQLRTLADALGAAGNYTSNTVGSKLKEAGTTHWVAPNTGATNEAGFNGRGAGQRSGSSGAFSAITTSLNIIANQRSATEMYYAYMQSANTTFQVTTYTNKDVGYSVRLLYAGAGTPTEYVGNNGFVYGVILIGSQYWIDSNLAETQLRDGSYISGYDVGVYTPILDATWAALTTGALCAYNDVEANSFTTATVITRTNTPRLDLFEDENISITSSVLDIQDISKNTTDYSNSFTVPASENNNKIFKHYYNADIDNSFDARTSVDGRIEIGGMTFRVGKILLQKVSVKSGKPSSYTINFWGNLVSVKDIFGDDKLSDLDMSAYDQDYTGANVLSLLQNFTAGYPILYNLLTKKQYYYNSDTGDTTQTDELSNICYQAGTDNAVYWSDLLPSIQLIYIIQTIENDYNVTFSRDFFGREIFTGLWMWLNNTNDEPVLGEKKIVDFITNDTGGTFINTTTNYGTFPVYGLKPAALSEWWVMELNIYPLVGFEDVDYTVEFYAKDGILSSQLQATGDSVLIGYLDSTDGSSYNYDVHWEIKADNAFEYNVILIQERVRNGLFTYYITSGSDTLAAKFKIQNNIPNIKIIDFLKGLFDAFKLVIIPQEDGTLYVNSVNDYYAEGDLIDITKYVDIDSVDVSRGDILNIIKYNFQEPQTIRNYQFKNNNNGIAYGDAELEIRDDAGKLLDGETNEITLPFEQIVYERLRDSSTGTLLGAMYGAVISNELKPVNVKPHIFYNLREQVNGQIGFIRDDGSKTYINGYINSPSHTYDPNISNLSLIFDEEVNEWNNQVLKDTLYTNFHETYISNLFNIKRRNFTYTCQQLPVHILLKLTLNDILKIGYSYYRIDKFTTNLVTGQTELNLVNAFENNLNSFYTRDSYIIVPAPEIEYKSYVVNLTTFTSNKVDLGSGTSWLTVGQDGSYVTFTATENTGIYRDIQIDVTDDVTGTVISFYFGQLAPVIDASTDTITADTTYFTADNNKNYL